MKKITIVLASVLMCLLAAAAFADGIYPAEKSRILPGLPPGMEAACTVSDGKIDIMIDRYKTDWDMVTTAAKKSGSLVIHPGIVKPEGAEGSSAQSDYFRYEGMTIEQSEQQVLNMLMQGQGGKIDRNASRGSKQGIAIGRYDEGTGMFIPEEIPSSAGHGVAVRWKMKDGSDRVERLRLTVRYTDTLLEYTNRYDVKADDIVPAFGMNPASITNDEIVGVETEKGRIVYRLTAAAAGKEVHTAVEAPDGLDVRNGWKAYLLNEGKETELNLSLDGRFGLTKSNAVAFFKPDRTNMLYKRDWAIKWTDETGAVRAVSSLMAVFIVGEPKLTVSYDGEIEPVPADRLSWTHTNKVDGLDVSYEPEAGIFHMSIDEKTLPANGKTDLSLTTVSAKITAPQEAASCVVSRLMGDVIYGNSGERMRVMGEIKVVPGQAVEIPELTERIYFRKHSVTLENGKRMSYFFPPSLVGEYGGETLVLEWLDKDGVRIGKRQQITLTTDAYEIMRRMSPSLTKNPNALVEEPTVVTENTGIYVAWAQLPQEGERIVRYEIALEDENGEKATPEDPVILYLPYPEGKVMEECENDEIAVHHQKNDGTYEEYSLENGKLQMTPYGLRMEVTSFSPYYISWEVKASEEELPQEGANLPQTGDRSNLVVWLLMAAGAMAAGMSLKKKKAA